MVIANPIYDVVFKRLMENERVAKFFIGTLLNETIETVEIKPQEFTYVDGLSALAVFRLDFFATIKTQNGELRKVLIEIQKAQNKVDLMRFRNYLGEQYKKEDIVKEKKIALPLTTIYILGFKLPEILTPCLKVERNYKDLINKTTLTIKSDFVEKLTHDSYIVQVNRITDRYQTRLDKLLSIFEQTNFVDDNKIVKEFKHKVDLEEVKLATDILHYSGTNFEEKKKIEIEQEAWRTVNAMVEDQRDELLKTLEEKEQAMIIIEQALIEKEQALIEKEQALIIKDQALIEKDQFIAQLLKQIKEEK